MIEELSHYERTGAERILETHILSSIYRNHFENLLRHLQLTQKKASPDSAKAMGIVTREKLTSQLRVLAIAGNTSKIYEALSNLGSILTKEDVPQELRTPQFEASLKALLFSAKHGEFAHHLRAMQHLDVLGEDFIHSEELREVALNKARESFAAHFHAINSYQRTWKDLEASGVLTAEQIQGDAQIRETAIQEGIKSLRQLQKPGHVAQAWKRFADAGIIPYEELVKLDRVQKAAKEFIVERFITESAENITATKNLWKDYEKIGLLSLEEITALPEIRKEAQNKLNKAVEMLSPKEYGMLLKKYKTIDLG